LGKRATLGAASFAMKSISDDCIALGSPAKVVIKPSI
jgi:serine acetyltransferase